MTRIRLLWGILSAAIALFFMQALRVLFSTMFGFIYDQVFEGPMSLWLPASLVIVILGFLAPAALSRTAPAPRFALYGGAAALARIALSVNDMHVRYWGAILIIIFGGAFLVGMAQQDRTLFWRSAIWAVILEQALRLTGATADISLLTSAIVPAAVFCCLLAGVCIWIWRGDAGTGGSGGGMSWKGGLAIGSFLFLETSLLSLPHAMARWAGVPYAILAVALLVLTYLPLYDRLTTTILRALETTAPRLALAFMLFAGLFLGYFFQGLGAALGLLVAQLMALYALVLVVENGRGGRGGEGIRFGAGMACFLVLNFLNAFAFTYPYTLPFMREMGWVVYMLACAGIGWAVLMLGARQGAATGPSLGEPALTLMLLLLVGGGVWSVFPRDPEPLPTSGMLRLATYNIHYLYDDEWRTTMEEIAETIEAAGVDVIAMQEVDAGRMTSYSVDNAYYLSRKLGMTEVYLPTVEHLTGIALLHKGNHNLVETFLLPSTQEQTGIIHVELEGNGAPLHSFAIWMGLEDEDTMQQVDAALGWIGDSNPASFGGDFNAEPDTPEVEAIREAGFADPFGLLGIDPAPMTSPAVDPESRIDFVWVRDLVPARAWVSESLASDHRMVVVEIAAP
jgi:endonuclease/exonuclease/phosphatase family metal-dependent hydrolase